ncbi:MAG TPA: O-antigen ligase family protein, partial [Solirubrobacteraceae bacterium]|nr:O-antigen ligase family protein [Solirubrobacteraceae bacterium]
MGDDLQTLAAILAAAAAGAALVVEDRRRRGAAMLAALALAAVALGLLADDQISDAVSPRPALAAAGGAVALVVLAALTLLFRRRPEALPLALLAVLPFRVPIEIGDETASLLLPLYGVIAAGCLAFLLAPAGEAAEPRARRLRIALAATLVLYAAQTIYSTDAEHAVKNLCFFYVPFALLFRLLLDVRWSPRLLLAGFGVVAGLAVLFAAVGFFEYATGRLLITNSKLLEANDVKPYFRVNSVFFDPNIYGRYLALTMTGLAGMLLWSRRPREAAWIAVVLAVLWGGLVLSLSQSSFGALLIGLAVLAALRWRARPVLTVVVLAAVASALVVAFAGEEVGVRTGSEESVNRTTSGRVELVEGALSMIRDRPVWGFGSGAFEERYRVREGVRSQRIAAVSHTTPLTIGAEQGAIGLVAYAFVLWAALTLLFGGVRAAVRRGEPGVPAVARAAIAAAFCGLVAHTLVYAAFLEDPLVWTLLAA